MKKKSVFVFSVVMLLILAIFVYSRGDVGSGGTEADYLSQQSEDITTALTDTTKSVPELTIPQGQSITLPNGLILNSGKVSVSNGLITADSLTINNEQFDSVSNFKYLDNKFFAEKLSYGGTEYKDIESASITDKKLSFEKGIINEITELKNAKDVTKTIIKSSEQVISRNKDVTAEVNEAEDITLTKNSEIKNIGKLKSGIFSLEDKKVTVINGESVSLMENTLSAKNALSLDLNNKALITRPVYIESDLSRTLKVEEADSVTFQDKTFTFLAASEFNFNDNSELITANLTSSKDNNTIMFEDYKINLNKNSFVSLEFKGKLLHGLELSKSVDFEDIKNNFALTVPFDSSSFKLFLIKSQSEKTNLDKCINCGVIDYYTKKNILKGRIIFKLPSVNPPFDYYNVFDLKKGIIEFNGFNNLTVKLNKQGESLETSTTFSSCLIMKESGSNRYLSKKDFGLKQSTQFFVYKYSVEGSLDNIFVKDNVLFHKTNNSLMRFKCD